MVFCYKIITDTPRRSGSASPARRPVATNIPSSLSQLVGTLDYENSDVVDAIPERDWRLLAALAKKREESDERERLADQFRRMWQKEKQEREMVEAETLDQYKRYLSNKRRQERLWLEHKQLRQAAEQHLRQGELLDCIRFKQRRSDEMRAVVTDQKRYLSNKRRQERLWLEHKQLRQAAEQHLRQGELLDCIRFKQRRSDEKRAVVTDQKYKRYLSNKRLQERLWLEHKQLRQAAEQHLRQGELLDCIRFKQRRSDQMRAVVTDQKSLRQDELLDCIRFKQRKSDEIRAVVTDQKVTEIVDKAIEEEARATLAADRRMRRSAAEECRRQLDLADARRREEEALRRRNALLRDASQRAAISNALSSWESTLLRQEVCALETARRASHAARAALTSARSARLARARDLRLARARKVAAITAQMREAVRNSKL